MYTSATPTGLVRLHNTGNLHFLTFSCHKRKPYLLDRSACLLVEAALEGMRYLHRNPVKRGLVVAPEDWPWSSFNHYATGFSRGVEIES